MYTIKGHEINGKPIDYHNQTVTMCDSDGNPTFTLAMGEVDPVEFDRRMKNEGWGGMLDSDPSQEDIDNAKEYLHVGGYSYFTNDEGFGWKRIFSDKDHNSAHVVTILYW